MLKPAPRSFKVPDDFHIIVAGGLPGYDLLSSYLGTNWANQTTLIFGATLTGAGRQAESPAITGDHSAMRRNTR